MVAASAALVSGLTGCAALHHTPKLMLLTVWREPLELEAQSGAPPMVETPEVELPDVPVGCLPAGRADCSTFPMVLASSLQHLQHAATLLT